MQQETFDIENQSIDDKEQLILSALVVVTIFMMLFESRLSVKKLPRWNTIGQAAKKVTKYNLKQGSFTR